MSSRIRRELPKLCLLIGLSTSLPLIAGGTPDSQNAIQVEAVAASPGQTGVVVTISAATARPLTILSLDLSFNPALCNRIENQALQGAGRTASALQSGGIRCPGDGRISVAAFDLGGGIVIPAGSGPIARWAFDVRSDAVEGEFPLSLSINASSDGPDAIPLAASDGALVIGSAAGPPSATQIPTLSEYALLALLCLLAAVGALKLQKGRSKALSAVLLMAMLPASFISDARAAGMDVDDSGQVTVEGDLTFIARHLLGLPPVPPEIRTQDPTIASDQAIGANVEALGNLLDVDMDGRVRVETDLVYIARRLGGQSPVVPDRFRILDPSIADEASIAAKIDALPTGNLAPLLSPVGNRTIPLGSTLTVNLEASDPDGDDDLLAFSATPLPLPANSSLATDGTFRFRPMPDQVADFRVTFTVRDEAGMTDSEMITISVLGAPDNGATALTGQLLDTNDFAQGIERPVVGATVSILGTALSTLSGPDGRFTLSNIPPVNSVLDIDSRNAAPAPDGSAYAGFREQVDLIEQVNNVVERPFFLPRIDASSLAQVDPSATTQVANAGIGVMIEIPPNTARNADGSTFSDSLSITEVPRGLAPVALPRNIDPAMLVTIQPVGVQFASPVPITFPNVDGLPAGSEIDIWSLDPDTGEFQIVGTGRVSSDGSQIETVSGGVRATDWHFPSPGPPNGTNETSDTNSDNMDADMQGDCGVGSSAGLQDGCLSIEHILASYRSLGVNRALRFLYKSGSANPSPIINTETSLGSRTAIPQATSAALMEVGGLLTDVEVFTQATREQVRHALQFDASGFSSGRYPYSIDITSHYAQSTIASTVVDFVLVNNEIDSPFGAGWTLDGLQRLHLREGEDAVTLVQGDGSAKAFIPQNPNAAGSKTDIAFVMDGSGSISSSQFQLQLEGFAAAVEDPLIVPSDGSVSVTVVQFARSIGQLELPLTAVASAADAQNVANAIRAISQLGGGTPLAQGVDAAVAAIGPGTQGARQVLCVSTDGSPSNALAALNAADNALAAGIDEIDAIGVGIGANFAFLEGFVRNGGVFSAADFQEFSQRIGEKLRLIVGGSPPGEFSFIVKNADSSFTRTLKDGTEINFDSQGFQSSIVDRNGNTTAFAYDGQNRLRTITDPVGKATTFTYGDDGRLDRIEDPAGRATRFEHDAQGNLIRIIDPDASSRSFAYDDRHLVTAQTDKRGNAVQYVYNEAGRLVGTDLPDGTSRTVLGSQTLAVISDPSSTSLANPTPPVLADNVQGEFADGRGNRGSFETDRFGGITKSTDPLGRITTIERDPDGLPSRVVEPNGSTTEMAYDSRGNLLSVLQRGAGLQRETRFEYVPQFNQVGRIIDPEGNETLIEYDARGNPVKVTDALGNEVSTTYDAQGLILTRIDENGNVTSFTYDAMGNLASIVDAEGNETRFERDAAGNITKTIEGFGSSQARNLTATYDAMNRPLTSTDGTGATSRFRHDQAGNLIETESPTGQVIAHSYDQRNRLVEASDPISGKTQFRRDGNGNVVEIIDSLGRSTSFEYDAINRLTRTIDRLGQAQEQSYDVSGNVVSFKDTLGQETLFQYDSFNRRSRRTDPLSRTMNFRYDLRDNLTERTDAKGQTIRNSYDALSRLVEIDTPDNTVTFTYGPAGNLLTVQDDDSSLAYTYDRIDRPRTAATVDVGVQPAIVLTSGFNTVSNRISLSDSLGGLTRFGYDAANRLTELTTPGGDDISLSYDASGRSTGIGFPNGVATTLSYDQRGLLVELAHQRAASDLARFSYAYNDVGNIVGIDEGQQIRNFSYDALDRLLTAGTLAAPETYAYDPEGNRVSSHLSASYSHDTANQLLEDDDFTYTYDDNGNLETKRAKASGELTSYVHNAQNQLVGIRFSDGTAALYRYDGLGRRIERNVDGSITRYVYDGEDIALEFDGSNSLQARYSHGDQTDQPLSQIRGGQRFFYQSDHQGSIRHITDSVGQIANSYDYDAYGQPLVRIETVSNPFTYTAREQDSESGLMYYRARYFDPRLGRFLQTDPAGFRAGDSNLYLFVKNNPANFVDPTGLILDTVADIGFIIFDIGKILKDNVFGDCDNLGENLAALGADSLGAITPFGTGFGAGVRLGAKGTKAAKLRPRFIDIPGVGTLDTSAEGVQRLLDLNRKRLNQKLGQKIGQGRLPFEASREGVESAVDSVRRTLENPTDISKPFTTRGGDQVIDIFSEQTGSTVRLRTDGTFDTLIPEKTGRFKQ